MSFSSDCHEIPSRTTPKPKKDSSFTVCQQPSMDILLDIPEDYEERRESVMSNMHNSENDQLAAQQQVNYYTYVHQILL